MSAFVPVVLLLIAGLARAEPLHLVFVGDVMLDGAPGQLVASGRDPFSAFAPTLSHADLAVGNLECAVSRQGQAQAKKFYTFRAHPRVMRVLNGRFGAMSVSNNHSGDYGKLAFLDTISALERNHIRYFGGGANLTAAHAPLMLERGGLRIALLGYNEFMPRSFEAGPDWPGVAWSEDSQVVADIRAARATGADLVIPFMHWGWEYQQQPTERQRQLAYLMIDAGADVVIGSHPHVTQGTEYYKGRLIVYSLGNFVFDGFSDPQTRLGWVLRLTVDARGVTSWDTLAARIDKEGAPHPVFGALTPCGTIDHATVALCRNPGRKQVRKAHPFAPS